jgi:hypothetical protein
MLVENKMGLRFLETKFEIECVEETKTTRLFFMLGQRYLSTTTLGKLIIMAYVLWYLLSIRWLI